VFGQEESIGAEGDPVGGPEGDPDVVVESEPEGIT